MHGGFFVVLSNEKTPLFTETYWNIVYFFFFFCGIIDTVMMYHGIL